MLGETNAGPLPAGAITEGAASDRREGHGRAGRFRHRDRNGPDREGCRRRDGLGRGRGAGQQEVIGTFEVHLDVVRRGPGWPVRGSRGGLLAAVNRDTKDGEMAMRRGEHLCRQGVGLDGRGRGWEQANKGEAMDVRQGTLLMTVVDRGGGRSSHDRQAQDGGQWLSMFAGRHRRLDAFLVGLCLAQNPSETREQQPQGLFSDPSRRSRSSSTECTVSPTGLQVAARASVRPGAAILCGVGGMSKARRGRAFFFAPGLLATDRHGMRRTRQVSS
jgi:hypothetical protein